MPRTSIYTDADRVELQRIAKLALSRARTQLAHRHPEEARQLYDAELARLRASAGFPPTPRVARAAAESEEG